MSETSTALVTGANMGIGFHIARLLAARGVTVYLGSRSPARGVEAAAEMTGKVIVLPLDVTDAGSVIAAAGRVGELDILVNNAGIMVDGLAPPDATVESFRRTYETNVFGVLAVTNAFLPALRRSAHPRIVTISSGTGSIAGIVARPDSNGSGAAYRSSKAALNALTVFYAQALPSFRVNALAPGLRRTELAERARNADGDPAEAAEGAVRLALLPDDGPTGGFYSWDGSTVPW